MSVLGFVVKRVLVHKALGVLTVATGGLSAPLHAVAEKYMTLDDLTGGAIADAVGATSDAVDAASTADVVTSYSGSEASFTGHHGGLADAGHDPRFGRRDILPPSIDLRLASWGAVNGYNV